MSAEVCTDSAIFGLLHGWCRVKLLSFKPHIVIITNQALTRSIDRIHLLSRPIFRSDPFIFQPDISIQTTHFLSGYFPVSCCYFFILSFATFFPLSLSLRLPPSLFPSPLPLLPSSPPFAPLLSFSFPVSRPMSLPLSPFSLCLCISVSACLSVSVCRCVSLCVCLPLALFSSLPLNPVNHPLIAPLPVFSPLPPSAPPSVFPSVCVLLFLSVYYLFSCLVIGYHV